MSRARTFVLGLAIGAALVVLPSPARAQGLTGRVRFIGGYTHETPETRGSEHDWWAGTTPEVSYLFLERRWLLRATYAFTANVHTRNPTEIANRASLQSSFELSKRTTLLVSADANQTSLSNYFITRPQLDVAPVVVTSTTNTRLFVLTGGQALSWEASPNVRIGQGADATYVTSTDPNTPIDNLTAGGTLSVDRTWKRDGAGVDLRGAFSTLSTPPLTRQEFITLTGAPRWRHDISPEFSSSLSAGISAVLGVDSATQSTLMPFGRASILYTVGPQTAELSYALTAAPNMLVGQMLQSHLVALRGTTPLSERHRVLASGSVSYLHGVPIGLREGVPPAPDIDAFMADVDVTWAANDFVQFFARGMLIAQEALASDPPFLRQAVILGIQLSSRSPDGVSVPVRFPQRVDRSDAAPRP